MTTDKKLKRVVRRRMAKTGEHYTTARREVLDTGPATRGPDPSRPEAAPGTMDPNVLAGYRRVGGPILQLSALANGLAARGAIAPHTGQPFSEAMLLGLGGGVGGGYFMFQFTGAPTVAVIGTRHQWHDDLGFLIGVMKRLGVTPDVFESGGRKAAEVTLSAAMAEQRPVLAWTDMASLPYLFLPPELKKYLLGVVGVCGADDERGVVLIDDRAAIPWELDRAPFTVARGLIATSRHRLLHIDPPPADLDLPSAVLEALRFGHRELTQPRIRNFGLPALAKWADLVANPKDVKGWPATLRAGRDLAWVLEWAHRSIEIGTGGGGYRALFAAFLDEAVVLTGLEPLEGVAGRYRDLAASWTDLADALLPASVAPLAELRLLERRRSQLLEMGGQAAIAELEAASQQKAALQDRIGADFPLGDAERLALFEGLRERIVAIHRDELAATEELHAIAG